MNDPTLNAVVDVVRGSLTALRAAVAAMADGHKNAAGAVVEQATTLGQGLSRLGKLLESRPSEARTEEAKERSEPRFSEAERTAVFLLVNRMGRVWDNGFCPQCGGVPNT